MLLGNITQEILNTWWGGINSPTAPILLVDVEASDFRCRTGGVKIGAGCQNWSRALEPNTEPKLEQVPEHGVGKYSLQGHFDLTFARASTS